ncbi:lambda family phage tail tape measure protein [Herbaspirillum seropedicae]|uniref:phage tail tape measure protein n=1 Tax=Herbaspirillum seropedicae TaxID=964 RepID=UPI0033919AD5
MASQQVGTMVVTLTGDVARYQNSMETSAQRTEQAMARIQASSASVEQSFTRLESAATMVKAAIAGIAVGGLVAEMAQLGETSGRIQGQLRLVTDSFAELKSVQADLFAVSQRTRQEMGATVDLYSKVSRATSDMLLSQKTLVTFSQAVNNSITVSGAGVQQAEAAILQLGQALASGKLQGDEYRSIAENAPRLAQAIADGMGVTRGELKKLSSEGKLTAEVIVAAVVGQFDKLQAEADKIPQTVGQSFVQLKNVILNEITAINEGPGIGAATAQGVQLLAQNLDVLKAAVAGVVAYKLGGWAIEAGLMLQQKASAALAAAAAASAERAALMQSTLATAAQTSADVASAEAKVASIVALREQAMVTLSEANATIAATQAIGAYSTAMAMNRAAVASRSAALIEMGALSRAQVAAETQLAAATAAATAAANAYTTAQAGASASAGLASRALGLLGGPIGAITTVLGLGVAAWQLWSMHSDKAEKDALKSVEESTPQFLARLDQQIAKLKERNALVKATPVLADTNDQDVAKIAGLKSRIDAIKNGTGDYAKDSESVRQILLIDANNDYAQAMTKIAELKAQQDIKNTKDVQARFDDFLDKYKSKEQKLADTLADFDKQFKGKISDAQLQKGRQQIIDKMSDKPTNDSDGVAAAKSANEGKLKSIELALSKQRDVQQFHDEYVSQLRERDLIDLSTYEQYRTLSIKNGLQAQIEAYDAEIAVLERYRSTAQTQKEVQEATNKISVLNEKKDKARLDATQKLEMQTLGLSAAQDQLNKSMKEWAIQQDQSLSQQQFELDMMGKSTLEIQKMTAARRIQKDVDEQVRQAQKNSVAPIDRSGFDAAAAQAIERSNALYDAVDQKNRDPWFNLTESVRKYGESATDVGSQIGNSFTTMTQGLEDAWAGFVTTGKLSFSGLAKSVIADIAKMQARAAISGLFNFAISAAASYFGGGSTGQIGGAGAGPTAFGVQPGSTFGSLGSGFSGMTVNALGGVYSSPSLSAYSGQIVSSPTIFAYAKGAGLMGEAGPEAIMPLSRAANGELGVNVTGLSASNAAATSVEVNVYVTSDSTSVQAPTDWNQVGTDIGAYVDSRIDRKLDREKRQGGLFHRMASAGG